MFTVMDAGPCPDPVQSQLASLSGIGESLLANTVDLLARNHVIHANFYPDSLVGTSFVEDHGYVITGIEEVLLPDGGKEYGFRIMRDDTVNPMYAARHVKDRRDVSAEIYDLSKDKQRLLDDVRAAEREHMVVTRFWADPAHPTKRHVVFESRLNGLRKAG